MGKSLYFATVVTVSSFFLAHSQLSEIGCLPYFHTWCGLSTNLECISEMCCTRLAENTGCQNYAKKIAICAPWHNCRVVYLHMSSQYDELQPTNGWDQLVSLGHPSKFQRFPVLASLLHRCLSMEANQTLHDVWLTPWLVHYVYILGAVVP